MKKLLTLASMLVGTSYTMTTIAQQSNFPTIGKIHRLDPNLDQLIDSTSKIEILGTGYTWSEGPVWVKKDAYLLFSDVPENVIFKWSANKGIQEFLRPSGYTGLGIYSEEPGSNGLIINKKGNLVSCEHGDRRIAEMPLGQPEKKKTLAHLFEGKKLNSPNDVVQKSNGDYFFTDPPYGLPGRGKEEPAKELSFQGVYRIDKKGKLSLQTTDLVRPNGLAFSPDEKILYVGQSDMKGLIWMAYPVLADGNLGKGDVFFDAGYLAKKGWRGAPDGFKIDKKGNLWATGPGGVLIISPERKLLGRIETGSSTANVAFGEDGSTLFITADMNLLRVKTKTVGLGF